MNSCLKVGLIKMGCYIIQGWVLYITVYYLFIQDVVSVHVVQALKVLSKKKNCPVNNS